MKNFLIIIPSGGICNRMRSIVGAARLAAIQNKKLIVFWLLKPELNARFNSLFENIPYSVFNFRPETIIYRIIRKFIFVFFHPVYIDDRMIIKKGNKKIDERWQKEFKNKNLFLYTCYNVIQDHDFSMFQISEKLKKSINLEFNEKPIGIHIRRTDNKQSIQFSPTSLFLEKIEEELALNPKQKFFLATDDKDEEILIKKKYPQTILTYKKRSLDRNTPEAIEDAVIDLYILSNCKYILGSYYSSFSDTAALWGEINKIVVKKDI